MISKKNKALAAGVLAAAVSASSILPSFASAATEQSKETPRSYAEWFGSLYDDVVTNGQENGYLSSNTNGNSFGIPYHAVETVIVEAPDYGHETTSEAMSYIVWAAAMRAVLGEQGTLSAQNDIKKAWTTMEALIPGWSKASTDASSVNFKSIWSQQRLKADTDNEYDTPQEYNGANPQGDAVNPLYEKMKSAYGSDNGYYLMHWLADVDNWYGFGNGTEFTFINTFQRGKQESCFETVPHPCIERCEYGMSGQGLKAIFNGLGTAQQYAFTNAPDAEDRAIQAIYFANLWGVDTGDVSALAGKMGDQMRNDMFDKYYKEIGCQDMKYDSSNVANSIKGQHYLMAWYTSWGGALQNYDWAWQIGCSHSHEFYQNPLAAYALLYDDAINAGMKSDGADVDYKESLKRQIEMYLWLQSKDGPIAGGCTNSWNGRYEDYPSGQSQFYKMAYVEHPVYADPGSNHWIGNQVWAVQRLAELYYYVTKNGDESGMTYGGLSLEEALDTILSRWVAWFIENTQFDYVTEDGKTLSYAIPATLDWQGQPETWNEKYVQNDNLTCTIRNYGQSDVGCVSSLCNTLIYYAAAKKVPATAAAAEDTSSTAAQGLYLANRLLSAQWDIGRDDIGVSLTETNGSLNRIFEQKVYVPGFYNGSMPDGSKLVGSYSSNPDDWQNTFLSIRESYKDDPMFQELEAYYNEHGNTEGFELDYHRFWHAGDALMAYGAMALLYPEVEPIESEEGTTAGKVTLWGDANVDGQVKMDDVIKVMMYSANKEKNPITAQGLLNADCYQNGDGVDTSDALSIQKKITQVITELPESYLN